MPHFQPVQSSDQVAEVARLAREIWQEHYVPIIGQHQVDYMLEKFQSPRAVSEQLGQSYEYYLVTNDNQSAGYVALLPNPSEPTLLLSKLYVKKTARGHGLGKDILQFVENLCREREIKTLWLTVNKNNSHSIAWYTRMGFQNTGPITQDIGGGFIMDDFRMEKPIPP